jgi:hypothetical protein
MVEGNPTVMAVGDHMPVESKTAHYMDALRQAIFELVNRADQSEEFSDPDNRSASNPRILTIPLVKPLDGDANGKNARRVEVIGFASFYVLNMRGDTIQGHFIDTPSTDGEVDSSKQPSQGNQKGTIRPVRLIE